MPYPSLREYPERPVVDHLVPLRRLGERAAEDTSGVLRAFVRAAESTQASSGHHNRNYVLPLTDEVARHLRREPGTIVTVRIRRQDALPVVIRTWQDEAAILDALQGVLPHAPACLVKTPYYSIHSYVEGVPLSTICGNGKPVDTLLMKALAGLLVQMTQVRLPALPALPKSWPANHSDSQAFLKTLVHLADEEIRKPNWAEFGGLFKALGVCEDALLRLADRVPAMTRRPYSLLHADLHRDNLIVSYDGVPPLVCVDWELATYGDPLHDLATHLVRMQYPDSQRDEVIQAWADTMQETRFSAAKGFAKDLPHYLDFERAQSLYPDVMRAARSLQESFTQKSLDEATVEVGRALREAAEPLRLRGVPANDEIERALFRWLASRGEAAAGGRDWIKKAFGWQPDPRLPENPRFPASAVREALLAEGAAPANRVFKGTAHLNSVVWTQAMRAPVVVRRKLPDVSRREPRYLSEHSVLRAIQEAPVRVAAPEVLALGESYRGDQLSIQTYEGTHADRPPSHPVNGLLPYEADALVDQLAELARVDYRSMDPAQGEFDFLLWLKEQLCGIVRDLPKESLQLARMLGLPDEQRLRELLSRYGVSRRAKVLLHGDLNPWNLVRRDDDLALTIIDWEMALIGDPLYDLVRHMHLTPTRPEIRERMFLRWQRRLTPEYTRDWGKDWMVYRRIEMVRSAYIDLDRLATGSSLDAPNVRRAVNSYAGTLASATAALGLPLPATANPYLARALA
ncbi:aminoglycoside phosphotransferase family protein [Streptomyces sp. NBC_00199]|uniref:aminoglycoside phosphotransferase family protein n=1 Tax=Streptomyces sp. NBC_00199 TaxID=2975678 RepID=UPI002259E6A3|nr:aminoglycoside phosphotransferase family protein [Streptomyces sp. NBC_00199]MCX5265089.1 aminoglycoside phosphotransferase family protein [Streptomyces sp. NBC_00199]